MWTAIPASLIFLTCEHLPEILIHGLSLDLTDIFYRIGEKDPAVTNENNIIQYILNIRNQMCGNNNRRLFIVMTVLKI